MEEMIQIAGFFLGDGFLLDNRVAFSNTNEDLINHYANIIGQTGFKTRLYKRKKQGNRKDEFTLVAEKKLSNKMRLGMNNSDLSTKEKCKAFLRGIFDAEGTISFSSTRRGRQIKITNTDWKLILLVKYCLIKLGIEHRISLTKDKRPNRKDCFDVKTYGQPSIKFIKTVRPYKLWSKNYLKGKVHPSYLNLFQ